MTTTWYRPKRKADLIRHLMTEHRRDHVVSGPRGERIGTESELRNLYAQGWTIAVLSERHDGMHRDRDA